MRKKILISLCLAIALILIPCRAASHRALAARIQTNATASLDSPSYHSISELAEHAEWVVRGKVTDKRLEYMSHTIGGGRDARKDPTTICTIQTEEIYKGGVPATFNLLQMGGGPDTEGFTPLSKDAEYVMFLVEGLTGSAWKVNEHQSIYTVSNGNYISGGGNSLTLIGYDLEQIRDAYQAAVAQAPPLLPGMLLLATAEGLLGLLCLALGFYLLRAREEKPVHHSIASLILLSAGCIGLCQSLAVLSALLIPNAPGILREIRGYFLLGSVRGVLGVASIRIVFGLLLLVIGGLCVRKRGNKPVYLLFEFFVLAVGLEWLYAGLNDILFRLIVTGARQPGTLAPVAKACLGLIEKLGLSSPNSTVRPDAVTALHFLIGLGTLFLALSFFPRAKRNALKRAAEGILLAVGGVGIYVGLINTSHLWINVGGRGMGLTFGGPDNAFLDFIYRSNTLALALDVLVLVLAAALALWPLFRWREQVRGYILGAAGFALLITGGVVLSSMAVKNHYTVVPALTSLSPGEAAAALAEAGLVTDADHITHDGSPVGPAERNSLLKVKSTLPVGGEFVEKGRAVELSVEDMRQWCRPVTLGGNVEPEALYAATSPQELAVFHASGFALTVDKKALEILCDDPEQCAEWGAEVLPGAKVRLVEYGTGRTVAEVAADAEGSVSFENLPGGVYYYTVTLDRYRASVPRKPFRLEPEAGGEADRLRWNVHLEQEEVLYSQQFYVGISESYGVPIPDQTLRIRVVDQDGDGYAWLPVQTRNGNLAIWNSRHKGGYFEPAAFRLHTDYRLEVRKDENHGIILEAHTADITWGK